MGDNRWPFKTAITSDSGIAAQRSPWIELYPNYWPQTGHIAQEPLKCSNSSLKLMSFVVDGTRYTTLSDSTRRRIIDRLSKQPAQSLFEVCHPVTKPKPMPYFM